MQNGNRILLALLCVMLAGSAAGKDLPDREAGYARVATSHVHKALSKGLNVIHTATLPCASSILSCKFGISAMVIISTPGSSTPWSICASVDGQPAEPPCADQQDTPIGHAVTGTSLQALLVTEGKHDVELDVNIVSGTATLEGFSVVYQAYP